MIEELTEQDKMDLGVQRDEFNKLPIEERDEIITGLKIIFKDQYVITPKPWFDKLMSTILDLRYERGVVGEYTAKCIDEVAKMREGYYQAYTDEVPPEKKE